MYNLKVILLELPGFETTFQGSLHNHVSPMAIQALNKELREFWYIKEVP
jgi:hypothetical protein